MSLVTWLFLLCIVLLVIDIVDLLTDTHPHSAGRAGELQDSDRDVS